MDVCYFPANPPREEIGGSETARKAQEDRLPLEIKAWAELLIDFYEYKRKRKIDADRGRPKMESKVDTKTNKVRFPVK